MENIELKIMVDPIFDYQVKSKKISINHLFLVSADIDWRQHSGKELSPEIFFWWWAFFLSIVSWDEILMLQKCVKCGFDWFLDKLIDHISRKICWSIRPDSWGRFLCKVVNCFSLKFKFHFSHSGWLTWRVERGWRWHNNLYFFVQFQFKSQPHILLLTLWPI